MWISEFMSILVYTDKFKGNQCCTKKLFWINKAKQKSSLAGMLLISSELDID